MITAFLVSADMLAPAVDKIVKTIASKRTMFEVRITLPPPGWNRPYSTVKHHGVHSKQLPKAFGPVFWQIIVGLYRWNEGNYRQFLGSQMIMPGGESAPKTSAGSIS